MVVSVAAHCAARSLRGGGGRGGGRELQLDDLLDAGSALGEVEDVGALGQARAHLVGLGLGSGLGIGLWLGLGLGLWLGLGLGLWLGLGLGLGSGLG